MGGTLIKPGVQDTGVQAAENSDAVVGKREKNVTVQI